MSRRERAPAATAGAGGRARSTRGTVPRRWVEPAFNGWPARVLIPSRRHRDEFIYGMNDRFGLEHQRPMDAADVQSIGRGGADFQRFIDRSVLPLMLRDARQAGLTLCCRARAAAAGRRPTAGTSRRRCALRARTAGLRRGPRRRLPSTTPATLR